MPWYTDPDTNPAIDDDGSSLDPFDPDPPAGDGFEDAVGGGGGDGGGGSVVDDEMAVFSPSLFTSTLTLGVVRPETLESIGIPAETTIGDVSEGVENSTPDQSEIAQTLRWFRAVAPIAAVGVVGLAVVYVLGQLLSFEFVVGDGE